MSPSTSPTSGWRGADGSPGAWRGGRYANGALFDAIACIAERGLLDMLIWSDGTSVPSTWERDAAVRWGASRPR
jgi:hypothetical protein